MLYFIIVIKSLASSTTSLRLFLHPSSDTTSHFQPTHFTSTHPCCADQILFFLRETASTIKPNLSSEPGALHRMISIAKSLAGAQIVDRWRLATVMPKPRPERVFSSLSFVQQTLLTRGVYVYLNPLPPVVAPPPPRKVPVDLYTPTREMTSDMVSRTKGEGE